MSEPAADRAESPSVSLPHPLQIADFRAFWIARLCGVLGATAQSAAVAWQVYLIARDAKASIEQAALYIGMLGLSQFLAQFVFTIPGGIVADRLDRKAIILTTQVGMLIISLSFFGISFLDHPPIWALFLFAGALGIARAFNGPAMTALAPKLVPAEILPRAIAVNGIAFQAGMFAGPALGGFLIGFSPHLAYGVCAVLVIMSSLMVLSLKTMSRPEPPTIGKIAMVREGWAYIWRTKIVLGAISLDLFAVFLGGAVALMPIFVRDILHGTASQFGFLRASPAIGATLVSVMLSTRPIVRHAGKWMFAAVAAFGLMTIAFGLSRNIWLSMAIMVVLGGVDMISVFVRGTLVQVVTPDAMRGRVSAVSLLFIGASYELGEFESGVAARFLGVVGSCLFGGIGSLAVTGLWMMLFPELRQADRLEARKP